VIRYFPFQIKKSPDLTGVIISTIVQDKRLPVSLPDH
jgi:hypothetical protein